MADAKQTALSIVIKTVDNATAGIQRINARIAALTSPVASYAAAFRGIGSSVSALANEAGLQKVVAGFKGVHTSILGVANAAKYLAGVALGVGVGTAAFFQMVDESSALGRMAKRLGLTVDQLAQLRYAAQQTGSTVEEFDAGFMKFNRTMGELRMGGGQLTHLLSRVSPMLLKQLKATKDSSEAFHVMADAVKKVEDPSKRALLTTAAFGRGGQALVATLAKGSATLREREEQFDHLAGSQAKAAEEASALKRSMREMDVSMMRVKAAIVQHVAPAMRMVVERLIEWEAHHRKEIAEFIRDFGEKLPDRIRALISAFTAVAQVIGVTFDALGGMRTVAAAVAAVVGGPLLYAIGALGVALLATPIGWIAVGLAGLIAAGVAVAKNWDYVSGFFVECWNVIKDAFSSAWAFIKPIVDKVVAAADAIHDALAFALPDRSLADQLASASGMPAFAAAARPIGAGAPIGAQRPALLATTRSEAKVKVEFANAPKGTRVVADDDSTADLDVDVGYQLDMP